MCLFAEAARRLPTGRTRELLDTTAPGLVLVRGREVFRGLMAAEGEEVGAVDDADDAPPLLAEDVVRLREVLLLDWLVVEPALLGTLFEGGLHPTRRHQLGAHYTDRDAISRVLGPVMLAPLARDLVAMQAAALATDGPEMLRGFLGRLRGVRVLDPSCGAGNFLYVGLQALLDLEWQAIRWAAGTLGIHERAGLGPQAVLGIELNPQAAALARLTVWIAQLQWARGHGVDGCAFWAVAGIECRDALLELRPGQTPRRARWPDAEFIVGNPPFLGGKKLRAGLGDDQVDALFAAWDGHVPREADLGTYFHEMAREMIADGRCKRAGLLASQGIRGGANLEVLRKIKASGDIFMAWSDQPWIVEGAAVRVSIVAQDDGSETARCLDGLAVAVIRADLSGGDADGPDLTRAGRLLENLGVAFMGDTKGGAFDLLKEQAIAMLAAGGNTNGRPNSDVVVPWVNGLDVLRRPRGRCIIDFGVDMSEHDAAQYVQPFAQVRALVRPARSTNKRGSYRERWWIHVEARPGLRAAIQPLRRFIATPTVGKHRIFVWLERPTLPDHQLIVVASQDAYVFGVLHSRVHELWSLRMCSWLGMGNDPRYTPTTTFETFPFPWPLVSPGAAISGTQRRHRAAIAAAADSLDLARRRWLAEVSERPRTLTGLYNARPVWLAAAHAALDRAVLAAYGWDELADDELLARLLGLNHERARR